MDFFLLDTNFFREATKAPNDHLLARLIPALRQHGFDFGAAGSALRISPFSLLEALGIVVKMPPGRTFPVTGRDPKTVFMEIFQHARDHFEQLPELQGGHVQRKHDEQLAYLSATGRPLFDECITAVLARMDQPTDLFASFLSMDYFVKYPFSPDDFQRMAQFLVTMFFMDVPEDSPTSRYRMRSRPISEGATMANNLAASSGFPLASTTALVKAMTEERLAKTASRTMPNCSNEWSRLEAISTAEALVRGSSAQVSARRFDFMGWRVVPASSASRQKFEAFGHRRGRPTSMDHRDHTLTLSGKERLGWRASH
jgi:hypothetical protein